MTYVGLDISTSTIGICVFGEERKLLELSHINPVVDKKGVTEEMQQLIAQRGKFLDFFEANIAPYAPDHIFVEAPLMSSNNQMTVIRLIRFNTLISAALIDRGYKVTHVRIYDARAHFFPEYIIEDKVKGEVKRRLSFPKDVDKKALVLKKVREIEPQVQWLHNKKSMKLLKENYDMADAYVVCYAGMEILELP